MSVAPEARPERTSSAAKPKPPSPLNSLVLVLAVVALLLAAVNWLELRQAQAAAETLQAQLAALQQSAAPKDALASEDAATQQSLKAMGARVDDLDAAYTDLRKHSEEGRDTWIKAEAASLLVAANEEVQIRSDPALALKALQQADERLKLVSDPRLIAVRQEIAKESNALRAVPQADVEGMAVALTGLTDSVDSLPLKRSVPQHYTPGGNLGAAPAADAGFWLRFKAAFVRLMGDMFTVRRHDLPVQPLLSPKDEFLLRRNLELKLLTARSALLEREGPAFKDSAASASAWLKDYFDPQDKLVASAVQQLDAMQQQDIAPRLPDISTSLVLLRQLESPRNSAP